MRKLSLLIIVISSLIFSGCLDIEHSIKINKDGSGSLELTMISDPMLADEFKNEKIMEISKPEVKVKNVIRWKKYYHIETVEFRNLSELVMNWQQLSIKLKNSEISGNDKKLAIFQYKMFSNKETNLTTTEFTEFFLGHYYNFILELPGEIMKVHPLVISGIEIEPVVNENIIIWNIPLNMMEKQNTLVIKVDFVANDNTPFLRNNMSNMLIQGEESLNIKEHEYAPYYKHIKDKISWYWLLQYGNDASINLLTNDYKPVIAEFRVLPSGKIVNVIIADSAGNEVLAPKIRTSVENTVLDKFPDYIKEEYINVRFNFYFFE